MARDAWRPTTQRSGGGLPSDKHKGLRIEKTRKNTNLAIEVQQSRFQGVLHPSDATPRPVENPRDESPLDKPLPSLPIATILSKSPMNRRSLIDCTERPLRRSVSPSSGPVEVEEDWPALSPERLPSCTSVHQSSQIRPSIGESVIEGINNLHLGDEEGNPSAHNDSLVHSWQNTVSPLTESSEHRSRSSFVRPTKTSLLREQLSNTKRHENNRGQVSSPFVTTPIPIIAKHSNGLADNHLLKPSEIGPVRSKSKVKYGVNGRGSPYMIPRHSQDSDYDQNERVTETRGRRALRPVSADSLNIPVKRDNIAAKAATDSDRKLTSFVPLPTTMEPKSIPGNVEVATDQADDLQKCDDCAESEQEGAIITVTENNDKHEHERQGRSRSVSFVYDCHPTFPKANKGTPRKPSPFPMLSNITNGMDVGSSASSSETEVEENEELKHGQNSTETDQEPLHVQSATQYHSAEGNTYRIKHLSLHAPEHGPLLRISTEADEVIMGSDTKDHHHTVQTTIKTPANLRESVILKEHLRQAMDFLDHPSNTAEDAESLTAVSKIDQSPHDVTTDVGSYDSFVAMKADPDSDEDATISQDDPAGGNADDSGSVIIKPEAQKMVKTESVASDWPLKRPTVASDAETAIPGARDLHSPSLRSGLDQTKGPTTISMQQTPAAGASSPPIPEAQATNQDIKIVTENIRQELLSVKANGHPTPPARNSSLPASSGLPQSSPAVYTIGTTPAGWQQSVKRNVSQSTRLPRPVHRSFSQSIRDIDAKLDETKAAKSASSKTPRGVVSNIRGLFHKRSQNLGSSSAKKQGTFRAKQADKHRPVISSPLQADFGQDSTIPASMTDASSSPMFANRDVRSPGPNTPVLEPVEIREATRVAFDLLDLARETTNTVKALELVKMGKLMVQVVTAARNAEKAFEQAKQAAVKSEIMCMQTRKALAEMTGCVETQLERNQ